MANSKTLKLLFVEDVPQDFELAGIELKKSSINFISVRVEKENEFINAITDFKPDLIISDYSLPEFDGMKALKLLLEYDSSIPFIILTGTLNEETAVDCMKAGATDYVIKEHLGKLPFAVREAMSRHDAVIEKLRAEEALLESESRYRSMFENNYAVMLLISPGDSRIIDANPAALSFYGFLKNELCSKKISDISNLDKQKKMEILDLALQGKEHHYYSSHKLFDGSIKDVEIFIGPIQFSGKVLLYAIIHDVTERKRAETALNESLMQKNELIREIYHRTKNSLQVILSMFAIQSNFAKDDKVSRILMDMENRIMVMSLVHEKLYQSRSLSRIDLKDYIMDLLSSISYIALNKNQKVAIIEDIDPVEVLIDTAIPCGLILNELISNSFKHAANETSKVQVTVKLRALKDKTIDLTITDNGPGLKEDFDLNNIQTFGLQIVRNIVEYQLKGSIERITDSGTGWHIRFKDDIYEERI